MSALLDRLLAVAAKPDRRIIGVISGMSMDGVDLALVQISGMHPELTINLQETFYLPYPPSFRERLVAGKRAVAEEVCRLNFACGDMFAQCINDFLAQRRLRREDIDAIGSHGQTLVHNSPGDGQPGSTLQLGALSVIAQRTGCLTVGNFRHRDMALGGEGAPLVPLLDLALHGNRPEPVALHNLGSISNLSVVGGSQGTVIAFDTGPANQMLDALAARLPDHGASFDPDGQFAARGKLDEGLLARWLAHPYFERKPPKSAGYGEFRRLIDESATAAVPVPHLLRTAVELCATTIADAYRHFVVPQRPELRQVWISGGGVHNGFLLQRIQSLLHELNLQVTPYPDARMLDSKEAVACALLANEALSGRAGNLPEVTGAQEPVVCGEIAL